MSTADVLAIHAMDAVCHLPTIGRRSGRPRTIEIWFATDGDRIYLLAGGRDRAH
jgi:nitroimidazol reductase NimA-like FMN-containing flavoprotein (pyridoxamine 5'-phosphate oxidase superfamily)